MAQQSYRVLAKMLERLLTSMASGPSLNCRPHSSRQRLDLTQLQRLEDRSPTQILLELLGEKRAARVIGKVPRPRRTRSAIQMRLEEKPNDEPLAEEERVAIQAWEDQARILTRLRTIVDDARTYEQDTGAYVLNLGFPLLSLPPEALAGGGRSTRRILSPLALVPLSVVVRTGGSPAVELQCRADGADLVAPNAALLAWLEQYTGRSVAEIFADEKGEEPWREIAHIAATIAGLVDIKPPAFFSSDGRLSEDFSLEPAPRAEELDGGAAILPAAVLGLYPVANQGLLRDTQAMLAGEELAGPIVNFISLDPDLEAADRPSEEPPTTRRRRVFAEERLVAAADPCQSRAVRLARECDLLVIHGPPGTGKSQTILNIIGDHLSRGQRVLFVCDKRTAVDVVANRMEHLGLRHLCALVYDPQRDRRELYRSIRQQLDDLADAQGDAQAQRRLTKLDSQLQAVHDELSDYHRALCEPDPRTGLSFHDLVGSWISIEACNACDEAMEHDPAVAAVTLEILGQREHEVQDLLSRAAAVGFATNPWREAAGIALSDLLGRTMHAIRISLDHCAACAEAADATAAECIPPFNAQVPPADQARQRKKLAAALKSAVEDVDAGVLERWSAWDAAAATRATEECRAAAATLQRVRQSPLDEQLAGRTAYRTMSRSEVGAALEAVRGYAAAYGRAAARFAAGLAHSPGVRPQNLASWLRRDRAAVLRLEKRLAGLKPVAETIAARGLDRRLLSQLRDRPLEPAQMARWQSALEGYLQTAGRWYAFLYGGRRKAAQPVADHFGLDLSVATAQELSAFFKGLRARLDLRGELEEVTNQKLPEDVTDEQLLAAFDHELAAAGAAAAARPDAEPSAAAGAVAAEHVELVNSTIEQQTSAASAVLAQLGLGPGPAQAEQAAAFLEGIEARLTLWELARRWGAAAADAPLPSDERIGKAVADVARVADVVAQCAAGELTGLSGALSESLRAADKAGRLIEGLERSEARAGAIEALAAALNAAGVFHAHWRKQMDRRLRAGECVAHEIGSLRARVDELETVLRVREELEKTPPALRDALAKLLEAQVDPAAGSAILRRAALANEIRARLKSQEALQSVDSHRLTGCLDRYQTLEQQKRQAVRDAIVHEWTQRQRQRLLAPNGKRLGPLGAELRRRLTIQGERAMRLRQVITLGAAIDGGDPLFDLRPVWMASPETVAQLFPRRPIFDVVIFDEASQCRLEEALPVLTRGRRAVIAGDPKQLPPTRFFESAIAQSDEEPVETEEQLFEARQGEIEDLLAAALNLTIQESHLDVHYRSRNSDLIEFSNQHFYDSRLQPIPAHPSRRARTAPLTLHRVDGVYDKRCNVAEAEYVARLVRDLLMRPDSPSIGIASLNLQQRDLIVDELDELAAQDEQFARKLAEARERRGEGSFEGLFVKNLENVQGDERDFIIISTTYGRDPGGRFYRRFGPLGRSGGGRRLNVLVTRARREVHVVSSIPREAYQALPDVPSGQTPTGSWLLFAYLRYAEELARAYEAASGAAGAPGADGGQTARPMVNVHRTLWPSAFVEGLAHRLAHDGNVGAEVYWGNDGFCVDVALRDPKDPEGVTIGVLCDMNRFRRAEDPVAWEAFRAGILQWQGWLLHRCWTPHFFRDPPAATRAIYAAARRFDAGTRGRDQP